MRKVFLLYMNEMFRSLRKVSTIVLLSVLLLGCLAIPFLVLLTDSFTLFSYYGGEAMSLESEKTHLTDQIQIFDRRLETFGDDPENESERLSLNMRKQDLEFSLESVNLLIENGYNSYEPTDFISQSISITLPSFRRAIRELEFIPLELRDAEHKEYLSFCLESIQTIYSFPQTKDFSAYVSMLNKIYQYSLNDNVPTVFPVLPPFSYEKMLQADPSGGTDGTIDYTLLANTASRIASLQETLDLGYTYSYDLFEGRLVSLSPQEKEQLSNQIAIETHNMMSGVFVNAENTTLAAFSNNISISYGKLILSILLIVLAGSAISQEIATGSIKSLIIAPVRRWKIFAAKILSLFSIMLGSLLILSLFSSIMSALVFGSDSIVNYVYVVNGKIASIPFFAYSFISLLTGSVDLLVYMTLAFTLSNVTRNTALSVALPLSLSFFASTVVQIFSLFSIRERWMDFIPFFNFELNSSLFPYASNMLPDMFANLSIGSTINPGLLFSSVYLIVLIFCLMYISHDSFTRRDIK